MQVTERVRVHRVTVGLNVTHTVDEVATEIPVKIHLDKKHIATLMASPAMVCELAVGYLFSEGILKDRGLIGEIDVDGYDVYVRLEAGKRLDIVDLEAASLVRAATTACVSTFDYTDGIFDSNLTVPSTYSISAEDIARMVAELNVNSRVFKATGGLHSAAIFEDGGMAAFSEDVGRHNAVDKVIGAAVLKGVRFERSALVTSGRQTADMVAKAARMGIPLSVSISAPINSGIKIAEKTGVTLICFARGRRFNIYTKPERVRLNDQPVES
ncbi:MAG: formate dehydrogenase accessory sulfurtransferase FdhD [Candidatus Bathyarchaeia archaeon]